MVVCAALTVWVCGFGWQAAEKGEVNVPSALSHACAQLAALKGVDVDTVRHVTTRNARALFGLPD